jgi:hypothetical protein
MNCALLAPLVLAAVGQEPAGRDREQMTAAEIVEWMTKETGKRFVYTNDLGLRNKVLRVPAEVLDPKNAYAVGIALLKRVDLVVVRSGNTDVLGLVPSPCAGRMCLDWHRSMDTLPQADEFCTLSIQLRHASPRDLQKILVSRVSFPSDCIANESTKTLILADYASKLRTFGQLVQKMDVAGPARFSYRVRVALLKATAERDPCVPVEFKDLGLERSVGKNHFTQVGEAFAQLDVSSNHSPRPSAAEKPAESAQATLRIGEVQIEFSGAAEPEELALEKFTIKVRGSLLLETRIVVKERNWKLVGAVSRDGSEPSIVALVQAVGEE